jgi:putative phosphoserine phosphatase/1-acylglycerol-3-phosphate O-acyltransferase
MAMAAGVPVVPIVIRNADDLGARDSRFMRPGTVDVMVLPPIDVSHWKLRGLDARIEAVRRRYIEALADWPGPEGADATP